MGRVFMVDLGNRTHYRCRLCESPLALIDDVLSRGERDSWTPGRQDHDLWYAYCGRCMLLLLRTDYWREIYGG